MSQHESPEPQAHASAQEPNDRFRGPRFDALRAVVAGYPGVLPRGLATSDGAVSVLGALWLAALGPTAHPLDLLEMTPAQAAEELVALAGTSDLALPLPLIGKLCEATAQAATPREARTFALVELDLLEAFWEGIRVGVVTREPRPDARPATGNRLRALPGPRTDADALIVHVVPIVKRPPRRDAE